MMASLPWTLPARVIALTLLGIGIVASVRVAPSAVAQIRSGCSPQPEPLQPSDAAIRVDAPAPGARTVSPLTVRGEARVFEGVVSLRLVRADGSLIAEGTAMATAGAPERAPFLGTVTFVVDNVTSACLMVYEASANDGSPRSVVQVPLVLLPSSAFVTAALDLSAPCIPDAGERACGAVRRALWDGEPDAWAARGVTNPDARFTETVVFRVRAGDPAAIAAIARLLGWPYVKVTQLDFAAGREVLAVTNLGGGAQDLTGWTVRSPTRDVTVTLPSEVLGPGKSCYVLTGRPGGTAGFECRVFTGTPENPPIAPPDGIWPDDAGMVVLVADPLGIVADAVRYIGNANAQPPPPNLQGVVRASAEPPENGPLSFSLTADRSSYPAGATVQFHMVWQNAGDTAQTVTFPTGQDFDVTVRTLDGGTIWHWAYGKSFTQSVRMVTLPPGEERSFMAEWDQRGDGGDAAGPGIYEATATLATVDPLPSNRVRLVIEANGAP